MWCNKVKVQEKSTVKFQVCRLTNKNQIREQSYDNTAVILILEKYFFSPYLTVHFPHPS